MLVVEAYHIRNFVLLSYMYIRCIFPFTFAASARERERPLHTLHFYQFRRFTTERTIMWKNARSEIFNDSNETGHIETTTTENDRSLFSSLFYFIFFFFKRTLSRFFPNPRRDLSQIVTIPGLTSISISNRWFDRGLPSLAVI